jgi:SMI1 / KNR4 family (SUKH-1)
MTAQFDFTAWVSRARQLMAELGGRPGFELDPWMDAPPLSPREVDALSSRIGHQLPDTLRGFLERGAAVLACRYTFEYDPDDEAAAAAFLELFPYQTSIYGGPVFGPADTLPDFAQSCAEWADQFDEAGDPAEGRRWRHAVPVIAVKNGDYIALDGAGPARDASDPPVVYLSHEGESALLAASFTEFLATWERLCYLGPEIWLLDEFRGPDGFIAAEGPATGKLRRLLGAPAGTSPPVA